MPVSLCMTYVHADLHQHIPLCHTSLAALFLAVLVALEFDLRRKTAAYFSIERVSQNLGLEEATQRNKSPAPHE